MFGSHNNSLRRLWSRMQTPPTLQQKCACRARVSCPIGLSRFGHSRYSRLDIEYWNASQANVCLMSDMTHEKVYKQLRNIVFVCYNVYPTRIWVRLKLPVIPTLSHAMKEQVLKHKTAKRSVKSIPIGHWIKRQNDQNAGSKPMLSGNQPIRDWPTD